MWTPFPTGNHWSTEISDITGQAEYQTVSVQIREPAPAGQGLRTNPATGETTGNAGVVRYSGQARVVGVRWGTFTQGEAQENSTTLKSVRLQIPKDSLSRIYMGWSVEILSSPRNPALQGRSFRVTGDFQGGSSATRTFECEVDGDS